VLEKPRSPPWRMDRREGIRQLIQVMRRQELGGRFEARVHSS
jgi:hypothetical protein